MVPIVEPEMTLGAGDYSIEDTSYWSERVLTHVFRHLNQHDVMLEGILMKPSMCLPGESAAHGSRKKSDLSPSVIKVMHALAVLSFGPHQQQFAPP